MSDFDLEVIKARRDAATTGQWEAKAYRVYADHGGIVAACWRPWGPVTGAGSIEADAEFIAHAPDDVSTLIAEVERLQAIIDDGKEMPAKRMYAIPREFTNYDPDR